MAFHKTHVSKISFRDKYAYLLLPVLLIVLDYFAVISAEQLAYTLRNLLIKHHGILRLSWLHFYVVCPVIFLFFLYVGRLYTRQMQFWRVIAQIFRACVYAILAEVLFMYVSQIAGSTSRLYTVFLGIFAFFLITLFRYIVKKFLDRFVMLSEPVLMMGAGRTAEILLNHINADTGISYHFIGFLEDNVPNRAVAAKLPCLGTFADAASVIRETEVQNVLVIAPGLSQKQIQDIIYDLQPLVRNISFIPDMGTLPLSTMDIESLVDGHVVLFQMRNNLKNKWNRAVKFVFDWAATLVGGVIIAPVMAGIAAWIWMDSPGPVIFKQKRVGQNGKDFYCYKFRTMCADAKEKLDELLAKDPEAKKEWEKNFKLKKDPRITRSGHFLRSTSLDELPQIFNVLKGEMSLVGPRPIIREEVHYYGKFINDYYMVRPGITGMWQTSGRSDTDYDQRVQMDSWYVRNWDFWFDIVLLWRTIKVVVQRKGAY